MADWGDLQLNAGISRDDHMSRCIIYQRFFSSDNLAIDELLWPLQNADPSNGQLYHESGVLRRIAIKDEDVHVIGCNIARIQNERAKERATTKVPPQRYYCGFRNALISDIVLSSKQFRIALTLDNEGGEKSHVDVAVEILPTGKSEKNTVRTAASMVLAKAFGVPVPHCCECDEADNNHPFKKFGISCLMEGLKARWPKYIFEENKFKIGNESELST